MIARRLPLIIVATFAAASCNSESKPPPPPKPAMVKAVPGPLAPQIKNRLAEAKKDNAVLLVYVGADWCEPCKRFKKALAAGELDKDLPGLRMLELDDDADGNRLAADGYHGDMLPRFVVPAPDGKASEKRIEGSVKGPGAPAEIVPRLRGLVANSL